MKKIIKIEKNKQKNKLTIEKSAIVNMSGLYLFGENAESIWKWLFASLQKSSHFLTMPYVIPRKTNASLFD